jgi:UDP-glucose 4-epimerase
MTLTILVTGCAGLIGSKFCDWLLTEKKTHDSHDIKVIGIDDLSGGYTDNINPDVIFYNQNLSEYDRVDEIFKKHPIDYIWHFAAYAAEGLSPFIRKFNYNNNLLVTAHLVNLAIKCNIKRFVFTSSMAIYGNSDGVLPFSEKSPQIPIDPYGVAKLACEMDLKIANDQHGLDYCIIRPHNVYGDKQNIWDKYRNVLGIWMYQLLNNEKMTIYGDGSHSRAFSYIDDILEPLWNAGILEKAKNQEINLGGIRNITLNEAAQTLIKVVGRGEIEYLEPRHEVKHAWCTFQKSSDLLDFSMKTELHEGLTNMWKWVQTQPARDRKQWESYELDIGLYGYWK